MADKLDEKDVPELSEEDKATWGLSASNEAPPGNSDMLPAPEHEPEKDEEPAQPEPEPEPEIEKDKESPIRERGLLRDLQDERALRQEERNKRLELQARLDLIEKEKTARSETPIPGATSAAPFGYITDPDTGEKRPATEMEFLEQPAKTGAVIQVLRQRDEVHKKEINDIKAATMAEIDEFKHRIAEEKFIEKHDDYDEVKAKGLAEIEADESLKVTYRFMDPTKKPAFVYRIGLTSDLDKPKKKAAPNEPPPKEKDKELAARLRKVAEKGIQGAGSGGASGKPEDNFDVEYYLNHPEEFDKLPRAQQDKILELAG